MLQLELLERGGGHGKGFAVVANEVKNLAEESKRATEEIGNLIKTIQVDIEKALMAMKEGQTEVRKRSEAVEEQSASMEQIASSSKEFAKMAQSLDEETNKYKL